MDRSWLNELREQGESFETEILSAQLDNLRGTRAETGLEVIYERYPELVSRGTFEVLDAEVRQLAEVSEATDSTSTEGLDRRAAELWLEFVGTNLERRATSGRVARRLAIEASRMVEVEGEKLPWRSLLVELGGSPNPDRRRAIQRAFTEASGEVAALAQEIQDLAHQAAAEVGDEDYVRWRSRLARFDVDALAEQAERLLSQTDDMAKEALTRLFRGRVEVSKPGDASYHDLVFALRAVDLERLLPREELWRVDDFLKRLGLDPAAGGKITRDVEERPHKSARAYCIPLKVPDDIVLVLNPVGGLSQWRSLLHEMGHALHGANARGDLPFELRRLGDASLSEGFAVLFDHLLCNGVWARRVLKLPRDEAENFCRVAATVTLMIVRRHAAKLMYEVVYHRRGREADELHVDLFRRATGGILPLTNHHLVEMDPELYCSRYVRAWLFEGAAHAELRERFDEDWFINPRAGRYLQSLFAEGQRHDLHELSSEELGRPLAVEPVVARFEEVLG